MKRLKTINALRDYRQELAGSIGFVPTMGYLHEGHLSLVTRSKSYCDHTVVSIFVNPTQFGPKEDLNSYPRDFPRDLKMLDPTQFGPNEDFNSYPRDTDQDLALLEKAGVDAVFSPSVNEMFPQGADTFVIPGKIAERLEGAIRPGHFRGVATVVLKLFNLTQPLKAFFGQKDAQQVAVIKKMVADLNVPVEIIVVPTVRESDGLAMSSRNSYLDPTERQAATVLFRSLQLAEKLVADGERDAEVIKIRMTGIIGKEPIATLDYISIADANSLDERTLVVEPALISLAVRIGCTRLIDNITLP